MSAETKGPATCIEMAVPDWVLIVGRNPEGLEVDVSPRQQSGAPTEIFELFVNTRTPSGAARERALGRRLPRSCSERHINFDGTFCLGLDRATIVDEHGGRRFWETVRTYLLSQLFAEKHGRWPPGRGLSHGNAAYLQMRAEEAASAAGVADVYATALDHQQGWLAGDLPEVVEAMADGTHACSTRRPIGPLQIQLGCARCAALANLVRLERERRRCEREFTAMSAWTRACCNTMPRCELRNYVERKQRPELG